MNKEQLIQELRESAEEIEEFEGSYGYMFDRIAEMVEGSDLVEVVRCKDCKHRPTKPDDYRNGFDLDFPDDVCLCQNVDDGWYSYVPDDDWFCPNAERRTDG